MSIDVKTEIVINRPREKVTAYATDPDNDPVWIGGISESVRLDDSATAVGSKVKRVASFLGKRIEYINEVIEYHPQGLLTMKSVSGPFPMTITYRFSETEGSTLAQIRIQGGGGGFYRLAEPLLARAVKRNISRDLKNLNRLLESKA